MTAPASGKHTCSWYATASSPRAWWLRKSALGDWEIRGPATFGNPFLRQGTVYDYDVAVYTAYRAGLDPKWRMEDAT